MGPCANKDDHRDHRDHPKQDTAGRTGQNPESDKLKSEALINATKTQIAEINVQIKRYIKDIDNLTKRAEELIDEDREEEVQPIYKKLTPLKVQLQRLQSRKTTLERQIRYIELHKVDKGMINLLDGATTYIDPNVGDKIDDHLLQDRIRRANQEQNDQKWKQMGEQEGNNENSKDFIAKLKNKKLKDKKRRVDATITTRANPQPDDIQELLRRL